MEIGIVGCGLRATKHLGCLVKHKGARLIGIVDIDGVKAREKAQQFGVKKVFTSFDAMVEERAPEAVHIVTPPASHAELVIKAVELGCHVFVEKPMALTVEEADRMITIARKNGVKLCVGHNYLLHPLILKIRELISTGMLGDVVHIDTHLLYDMKRNPTLLTHHGLKAHWACDLPLGLLEDLTPHPVSVLLEFLKTPEEVWAFTKSTGALPEGMPDELRVLVNGGNTTGNLVISLGIKPDTFSLNIYGTRMTVYADLWRMKLVTLKNRPIPKKIAKGFANIEESLQLLSHTFVNTFKLATGRVGVPNDVTPLIRGFYQSIEKGTELPIIPESARNVVAFMQEIQIKCEKFSDKRLNMNGPITI